MNGVGKMKKQFAALLAAAMLLGLCGCTQSNEKTPLETPSDSANEPLVTTVAIENDVGTDTPESIETEPTATEASTEAAEETTELTTSAVTEQTTEPVTTVTTQAATTASEMTTESVKIQPAEGVMYALSDVNVRRSADSASERMGHLSKGDSAVITGVTDNGWTRIKFKNGEYFVNSKYLSDKKPEAVTTAAAVTTAKKTETQTKASEVSEKAPAGKSSLTISGELIDSKDLGYKISGSLSKAYKTVGNSNPISSNIFFADPTAVEHDGRLYVYGTCDSQEFVKNGKKGSNTYGSINTLACFSTDDMKNWTYHGDIPVKDICKWTWCSWAPSIVKKDNAQGKTEFFLYFANSAGGIGVMKSDSPTGPWVDPIGKPLVSPNTNELSRDPVFWCFDPGVVVDDEGTGWLAFGGGDPMHDGESGLQTGNCRIVKLGDDMVSLASKMVVIEAPYHFEANELNYINGKFVLTYCSNWFARDEWSNKYKAAKPELCTMCYMVSSNPLKASSWEYKGEYVKNPTGYGYPFSNNHTHTHKFGDKYYLFYQNVLLLKNMALSGADGYRSVGVDEIEVNEKTLEFKFKRMSDKGAAQIKNYNPFAVSQAETCNVAAGIDYKKSAGRFVVTTTKNSWSVISDADFKDGANQFAASVKGKGIIELRIDKADGEKIGQLQFDTGSDFKTVVCELTKEVSGTHDLYFVFGGKFEFDEWQFANAK